MESSQRMDVWAAGALYEPYVGRWSRRVAGEFLHWLSIRDGCDWLDIGCGTGALTQTVLDRAAPASIRGIDPSDAFIGYAAANILDPRASFKVGEARSLPVETASCDAVVSGLVLNFVPEPLRAVTEMIRVVRPGGDVAVYVWDYAGRMELMRYFWDAAVAQDEHAFDLDEGRRFPICQPGPLAELFAGTELTDVMTTGIDVPTHFRDFDDYWTPFLSGQGPAPGYAMSLPPERRDALRESLRAALPIAVDGSIPLVARAWAVRGRRP